MNPYANVKEAFSFLQTLVTYSSVFSRLVRDSILRFRKDSILILLTGVAGSFFQISAIGQVIYYARAFEKGKSLDVLGFTIVPRSIEFFVLSMAVLLVFLLIASLLLYYSRSKIIKLSCSYETFCSKKVLATAGYLQGVCRPGVLSLYDNGTLLKLASRGARLCGRVLRRLIILVQPTFTFVIALGALFYINPLLTVVVLTVAGISMLFHYRNNLRGAFFSKKMDYHAPGAKKEKYGILKAARRINGVEDNFFNWMDSYFDRGEITDNLEAFRGRFQTLENARLINDVLLAILFFLVAAILGGNAIIRNANWGALIVYLVALRYCLAHLKKTLVALTSINRFYPIFAEYFSFGDSLDLDKARKKPLRQRYRIQVHTSRFQESLPSANVRMGDTIALVIPFGFNFYDIPIHIGCLLGHRQGLIRKTLGSMQVITEVDGYWNEFSFREVFHFPREYNVQDLHADLQGLLSSEDMIKQLPNNLDRPLSKEEWERIEPESRYSLGLLSVTHLECQWVVIDVKALRYLSEQNAQRLLRGLTEKITLIVFDGELRGIGTYGEKTVAVIDGQDLIGIGDVAWLESQKEPIAEKLASVKPPSTRIQKEGEETEDYEDDLLDEDDF